MNIAIIGGSGLYNWDNLTDVEWLEVETPYGQPSAPIMRGQLLDQTILFLPRHGENHHLLPSEINHRANLFALKRLGAEQILAVTACGSLQAHLHPGDIVMIDQYFDRSRQSDKHTFLGNGLAAHISLADPICPVLHALVSGVATGLLALDQYASHAVHRSGTYVNMEGPAFSTRAESEFYQAQGFDVIGMTSMPEARLAREAQLCYCAIALVTDYDCWHKTEEPVSAALVANNLKANIAFAREIILKTLEVLPEDRVCPCPHALENALMADINTLSDDARLRWDTLAQ